MSSRKCLDVNVSAANNAVYLFSSFLLDRLLQYERVDEDSSGTYKTPYHYERLCCCNSYSKLLWSSLPDSDATVSSDNSEVEGPRERERERDGPKK